MDEINVENYYLENQWFDYNDVYYILANRIPRVPYAEMIDNLKKFKGSEDTLKRKIRHLYKNPLSNYFKENARIEDFNINKPKPMFHNPEKFFGNMPQTYEKNTKLRARPKKIINYAMLQEVCLALNLIKKHNYSDDDLADPEIAAMELKEFETTTGRRELLKKNDLNPITIERGLLGLLGAEKKQVKDYAALLSNRVNNLALEICKLEAQENQILSQSHGEKMCRIRHRYKILVDALGYADELVSIITKDIPDPVDDPKNKLTDEQKFIGELRYRMQILSKRAKKIAESSEFIEEEYQNGARTLMRSTEFIETTYINDVKLSIEETNKLRHCYKLAMKALSYANQLSDILTKDIPDPIDDPKNKLTDDQKYIGELRYRMKTLIKHAQTPIDPGDVFSEEELDDPNDY